MKKLGFGMMRLPTIDGVIDIGTVEKMADDFIARGFTYFDTAYMYHNGKSEYALRDAVVKRHDRSEFTVADKMPMMFVKEAADLDRIFAEQKEKCGVDYFDYYLLHALDASRYEIVQRTNAFGFISDKKRKGEIKNIGFSFHDSAAVLDTILTDHPEVDFVQLQINYLDWESDNVQSRLCYETARRHNKQIVIMEPVKGGTLARLPDEVTAEMKSSAPDMSPASWAVRYCASLDSVLTVLSGMSDRAQLDDNTSYMADFKPLNDSERAIIDRAVEKIHSHITVPCTACEYCVAGCPQSIRIPELFSLYNAAKQYRSDGSSPGRKQYASAVEGKGKASDCIGCGQCEGMCPQHIGIIKLLKDVAANFERSW